MPVSQPKLTFSGGDFQQQVINCLLCSNVPQGEQYWLCRIQPERAFHSEEEKSRPIFDWGGKFKGQVVSKYNLVKYQVKVISSTDLMSRGLDTHDVSIIKNHRFCFGINVHMKIFRWHMWSTSTSRWILQTIFIELAELAGWEVARLVSMFLKFYCLSSVQLSLASQGGRVTSFVDNQGGVKVVQNLETAVRKNIEIQQVASKCFTGATILNLGSFSGEQQHY